jgi:metal-responsive CopG/Arc/MetJ family transcriptional regulator
MKTFKVTLDDSLVQEVNRAAKALGISSAAFTRDALRAALAAFHERELEQRHRAGYLRHPVKPGEFIAETRFRAVATRGSRREGLRLLERLERRS